MGVKNLDSKSRCEQLRFLDSLKGVQRHEMPPKEIRGSFKRKLSGEDNECTIREAKIRNKTAYKLRVIKTKNKSISASPRTIPCILSVEAAVLAS